VAEVEVSAAELRIARLMGDDDADLNGFRDTYTEKLRATIEAKPTAASSSPPARPT
jgi:hypothetical protein